MRAASPSGGGSWETLAGEIGSGAIAPGARLPTEAQLAGRFGVNRHTVRRAMEEISRSGLVRVEQGRGAFVAEDVLDYAIGSRSRFSEWIRRHNREPSGRNPRAGRDGRGRRGGRRGWGWRPGTGSSGSSGSASPMAGRSAWPRITSPLARFPALLPALRARATITEALADAGVPEYRRRATRVSARMPLPREAELLDLPRNRPVLVTDSIDVDPDDAVVQFGISRYPTPRVQLVFEPAERS